MIADKDKKNQHHDNRRDSLKKQIDFYKQRIKEYNLIEKQVEEINKDLFEESQKSHQQSVNNSFTGKSNNESNQLPQSKLIKRNTNRKIKIYQFQKKLQKLTKEAKQKQSNFNKDLQTQVQIEENIQNMQKMIQQQKKHSLELDELQQKLRLNNEIIDTDIRILDDEFRNLKKQNEIFEFQKKKLNDGLSTIRRLIKRSTNQTQPDEEFDDLSISNSLSRLALNSERKDKVKSTLFFVDNEIQEEQSEDQIQRYEGMQAWLERSYHKIQILENTIELYQARRKELMKTTLNLKNRMSETEMILKNNTITAEICKEQLQYYSDLNKKQQEILKKNAKKSQQLVSILNKIEEEVAQLKSKIGMKIQQQRLISQINNALSFDLQHLKEKLNQLLKYRKLFTQNDDFQ